MRPPPIPRAWLPHVVTAEPYLRDGAHGAVYGEPVELQCFHRGKTGSARASDGTTVTTSGSLTLRPEAAEHVPAGTRITDEAGRVSYVVAIDRNDSGGLVPLDHVRVDLA